MFRQYDAVNVGVRLRVDAQDRLDALEDERSVLSSGRCLKICLGIVFACGFEPPDFCQRYMQSYFICLCKDIAR
jgi:hypothetical protein